MCCCRVSSTDDDCFGCFRNESTRSAKWRGLNRYMRPPSLARFPSSSAFPQWKAEKREIDTRKPQGQSREGKETGGWGFGSRRESADYLTSSRQRPLSRACTWERAFPGRAPWTDRDSRFLPAWTRQPPPWVRLGAVGGAASFFLPLFSQGPCPLFSR